ncbi:MAG TPA: long-chain fatty acid--CoA ligase, partial [Gammaproteobacteria bacterium]|nr:long-chain fatty acid--CoA ligase [Gammaproteobacteria bacterium]
MTLNLADALRASAREYPGKTAAVAGNTRLTYAELDGLARRLAAGLAGLSVRRGEHVALLLPNVPQFTASYYAALLLGCPVVPLNVLLTKDDIAYHLADSDAVALIAWESLFANAAAACQAVPTCRRLIVAQADPTDTTAPEGALSLNALLAGSSAVAEAVATMPDDTAVLLYTSGTTGRPKGAELSHFNLHDNAECVATKLMQYGEDTVALAVLPLFHSFGQTVIQNATILSSGTLVFLPRFDAQAAFELMHAHRVTLFAGVPTMYFALLNHPDATRYDLSSLRFCVTGGAPMPVDVLRNFDRQYNVAILEGYGLSETSPAASFNRLDRPRKPGSIGLPLPGVEFKLVDDAGAAIDDPGVPGEIWIRGSNVMKGYYKKAEATAESIVDGWFKTGDVAYRDEDGFYFIVDRKKDMIIRGGFNVYPREVEDVISQHPGVAAVGVIGVPDEKWGEAVKAVVVKREGAE